MAFVTITSIIVSLPASSIPPAEKVQEIPVSWSAKTKKMSPEDYANNRAKYTQYFKGNRILPIPELVEAVQPKTISFIITDPVKHFTQTLIAIKNETIPKTSPLNRRNTPWLSNECKIAIRLRYSSLRKFNKEPSTNNLNSFNMLRAKARKTIKLAEKISGQHYVNQINSSTKTTTEWKMISKIAGKNQSSTIKYLIKNNDEVTNIKDIANTLAETFSENSSSDNTNKEFHNYKGKTKKTEVKFPLRQHWKLQWILHITRSKRSHTNISQHYSRTRRNSLWISQATTSEIIRLPTKYIQLNLEK